MTSFTLMRTAFILAVCALLSACRSTGADFTPDEFSIDYGRGYGHLDYEQREVYADTESQWVSFGLTWYLGESDAVSLLREQNERMYLLSIGLGQPQPAPTTNVIVPPLYGPAVPVPSPASTTPPTAFPLPFIVPPPEDAILTPARSGEGTAPSGGPIATAPPDSKPPPQAVTLDSFSGQAKEIVLYTLSALLLAFLAWVKREFFGEKIRVGRHHVGEWNARLPERMRMRIARVPHPKPAAPSKTSKPIAKPPAEPPANVG